MCWLCVVVCGSVSWCGVRWLWSRVSVFWSVGGGCCGRRSVWWFGCVGSCRLSGRCCRCGCGR